MTTRAEGWSTPRSPDTLLASVIVPVWRDLEALSAALERLAASGPEIEVIVAPALGDDARYEPLRFRHPHVRWAPAPRGRAVQMNAGAGLARGRWLLFLHADSVLPPDWLREVRDADARDVVAGAFRLRLDSSDRRARVVEFGVRARVALFGLPYGDQALFVRASTFRAVGGYRDLPLMEDVDLVRRLKRVGTLRVSRAAVLTSARRWERDGWLRRSLENVRLASRFLLGAPAAPLAQRYFARAPAVAVVMARAPWSGGKTRLAAVAGGDHASLRQALFLDTLEAVRTLRGVDHVVACEPVEASDRMRKVVGPSVDVLPQRGSDLGERLTHVFEDVFRLGAESAIVVGSDVPDLPPARLLDAVRALQARPRRVVLGPASDGGYYLIGLNCHEPRLFEGIDWSTDRVLAQTTAAARRAGLDVVLLPSWHDVDDPADLERVLRSSGDRAARTRLWGRLRAARDWATAPVTEGRLPQVDAPGCDPVTSRSPVSARRISESGRGDSAI